MTIADTRDIAAHFDARSGCVRWLPPEDATARLERNVATGFLDGVAVWLRENGRVPGEKSQAVMAYEALRARRALVWLEASGIAAQDRWDFTALTLACAAGIATSRGMAVDWPAIAPRLMNWAAQQMQRPSMQATAPLPL